jgi:hypothetical protein
VGVQRTSTFQLQLRLKGMRMHCAAEQQKPLSQAPGPVQSPVQLLPLQLISPSQEEKPRHRTRLVPALVVAPPAHEEVPMQVRSQLLPEQVIRF